MSLLEKVEKRVTSNDAVPIKGRYNFVEQAYANIFSNNFFSELDKLSETVCYTNWWQSFLVDNYYYYLLTCLRCTVWQ